MVTHTEAPFFNNSNGKNLNKTILKAGIKKMKNTGEGICSLNLHTKLQVIWPKNEEVESISRNGRRRRRRRRNISKNNVAHNTTTWCCEATTNSRAVPLIAIIAVLLGVQTGQVLCFLGNKNTSQYLAKRR